MAKYLIHSLVLGIMAFVLTSSILETPNASADSTNDKLITFDDVDFASLSSCSPLLILYRYAGGRDSCGSSGSNYGIGFGQMWTMGVRHDPISGQPDNAAILATNENGISLGVINLSGSPSFNKLSFLVYSLTEVKVEAYNKNGNLIYAGLYPALKNQNNIKQEIKLEFGNHLFIGTIKITVKSSKECHAHPDFDSCPAIDNILVSYDKKADLISYDEIHSPKVNLKIDLNSDSYILQVSSIASEGAAERVLVELPLSQNIDQSQCNSIKLANLVLFSSKNFFCSVFGNTLELNFSSFEPGMSATVTIPVQAKSTTNLVSTSASLKGMAVAFVSWKYDLALQIVSKNNPSEQQINLSFSSGDIYAGNDESISLSTNEVFNGNEPLTVRIVSKSFNNKKSIEESIILERLDKYQASNSGDFSFTICIYNSNHCSSSNPRLPELKLGFYNVIVEGQYSHVKVRGAFWVDSEKSYGTSILDENIFILKNKNQVKAWVDYYFTKEEEIIANLLSTCNTLSWDNTLLRRDNFDKKSPYYDANINDFYYTFPASCKSPNGNLLPGNYILQLYSKTTNKYFEVPFTIEN